MGVFNFLKKFSRKKEEIEEIKLDGLNDWVDSYYKDISDNIKSKLAGVMRKITNEKKKSKENLEVLNNVELRNKNVPERVKQIIDGNRETYIQKVNMLIEKIDLPSDFDKIIEYCDSFDKNLEFFGKNTLRSYNVLQEFFGDESRAIAENVRNMGKLIKDAKSILEEAKMDKIIELKDKISKIEQKVMRKIELKENVQLKKNELKTIGDKIYENGSEIKKIEEGIEYKRFIELIDKKRILKQKVSELKKGLWHSFSVIEPALKKYERITLNKELTEEYLINSLKTLLNDLELNIVKLLEKMKIAIIDKKIELKDKKMKKVLNELNKLDINYFKEFLRIYNELKSELEELKIKIDESIIIRRFEEIKKEVEYDTDKLNLIKKNSEDMIKEFEGINVEELKKNLEKDVLHSVDKRIVIL